MLTVMVTGVGAIIGYGILRSLRSSRSDICLIGADIYSDAIGQVWCDHFVQSPRTSEVTYANWLEKTVHRHGVDLLIPGIEQDVHFCSDHRTFIKNLSCKVIINDKSLIDLSRDKWAMHEALRIKATSVRIPSRLDGDFNSLASEFGVPFLLKPRSSYASKGLVKIHTYTDFNLYKKQLGHRLIAQPIVGCDEEEYTVSAFCDQSGKPIASITFLRKLAVDGSTAKAWVRKITSLEEIVENLCNLFPPIGPTNFQFRRDGEGWKLLEINPRISSASSLRTAFGYNEPEMCIQYFLEGKNIFQPPRKNGFAVRFIEDYIVYDRDYF